jgi:succinate dehydrogenase / fumarate reductase membrane anchor subunit
MRTALGKVRGLGSAKEGTDHFWRQRLTAIANVPLILFSLVLVIGLSGARYDQVLDVMMQPFVTLILALFILSVSLHMKLGMQTIIEDYVHKEPMRLLAVLGNLFFCIGIAAGGLFALLMISFGG